MNLIFAALMMLFATQHHPYPVDRANTLNGLDLCNYAKVKKLARGHYLSVRSGAGSRYKKINQLAAGSEVYTCDSYGDWVQIFYGSGSCSQTLTDGIDAEKIEGCQSGWVKENWIDIISG